MSFPGAGSRTKLNHILGLLKSPYEYAKLTQPESIRVMQLEPAQLRRSSYLYLDRMHSQMLMMTLKAYRTHAEIMSLQIQLYQ